MNVAHIVEGLRTLATPIGQLKPDPKNARRHPERNLETIVSSLRQFGQRQPIVALRDGTVIAGNGRLAAAKVLGWETIAVVRVDDDVATAAAYGIVDNRSSDLAEWDDEQLAATLCWLDEQGEIDVGEIGFTDEEIEALAPTNVEGKTDPDAVPEKVEPRAKRGDVWALGRHRLACGDATKREDVERLMGGEKAGMVLTDPPYGVLDAEWDRPLSFDDVSMAMMFSTGPVCMFNASRTDLMRNVLNFAIVPDRVAVWRLTSSISPGHGMFRTWQPIYVWRAGTLKGWDTVEWENGAPDKTGDHPTQKPIGLLEKWIGAADAKSVLDLFLGSGSTLIACEKTNRRCFGLEIDAHYCDVAVARWEAFTGERAVLVERDGLTGVALVERVEAGVAAEQTATG